MPQNKKLSKILAVLASFALLFVFSVAIPFAPQAVADDEDVPYISEVIEEEKTENLGDLIPCEGNNCEVCDIFRLISNVVNFVTFDIAAPLAGLILAYGGFKLFTSGGNETERNKGTKAIWAAVWGLLIAFGAWVIINAIIGSLAGSSFSESWYQFPGCEGEDVTG